MWIWALRNSSWPHVTGLLVVSCCLCIGCGVEFWAEVWDASSYRGEECACRVEEESNTSVEPPAAPTQEAQKLTSPAVATPAPASTVSVLASLLVQMKNRQATEAEMRPIVDAMAQLLAAGSAPVMLPNPTTPASPPPAKNDVSQATSSAPAVPAASPAVKTETSSPGPHTSAPAHAMTQACNSKSHASEYKAFTRFIESNANATELRKAFEPDPE